MELTKKAFKAYDVRGVVPTEVNAEMAYRVGRVFAAMFAAEKVEVGHDIRLSGRELVDALTEVLRHGGSDVIDIGQCGTEMIYFATAHLDADGGIMVTASHNPAEYNGMKLVRRGARPSSADTGLMEIADMVGVSKDFPHVKVPGKTEGAVRRYDIMPEYIEHLLGYIDIKALKPLKIVANPGNGGAGPVLNELAKYLPFEFIKINEIPDGTFPNGVPNPLLVPNLEAFAKLTHIVYKRQKTKNAKNVKPIKIFVIPAIEELLEWFKANTPQTGKYLLPIITKEYDGEQLYEHVRCRYKRINANLKKMGKTLGISLNLTTYTARHTMAMTLQGNDIPREIISQALGHSNLTTTATYLASFSTSVLDKVVKIL